jgi:N-formylglutamate deformylase
MSVYFFRKTTAPPVPILVSVPHCGIAFPDELKKEFDPGLTRAPDDTDWFVDQLYDFAPALGISMIAARYSRWVIDLNRDPESKPLYTDGRIITALCPTTTFLGEPLYLDGRKEISHEEQTRRRREYYLPYYERIEAELQSLLDTFGVCLLWDCHSIRRNVPTIQKENFPDLILGDADGMSASSRLIESALNSLKSSSLTLTHNHPFKGGYLTRRFGQPANHRHALQLEMSKIMYMDDSETHYHQERANVVRTLLYQTFEALIKSLQASTNWSIA